jgi:acetylornithine deacetylase/succinyl-diaminopimelate desuccinylase-like protein
VSRAEAAPRALDERDLRNLDELLSIQSVSTDRAHADNVTAAAEWIAAFVEAAGGEADLVDHDGSRIVDATLRATANRDAPTILCYGHFDVQPPGPAELWQSPPFEPTVRDGWLIARGVADDKGQLWTLLRAAAGLAQEGALPVNVRFCCDGEEEIGGGAIVDYLEHRAGDAVACVIFDTPMLDDETHVFTIGTRGTLSMHVEIRTGTRDLHSGVYGGAALNALHVLTTALGRLFTSEARVAPALRVGVEGVAKDEATEWRRLPAGGELLASQGAVPADTAAAEEFYERTWALPSLDVNGIEGGSPVHQKTIVVAEARANLSMRLAPGQTAETLFPVVDRELRRGLPQGATLELTQLAACNPGRVPRDVPAVMLAAEAFERVLGRRPLLLRSGGSLPIMPLLQQLDIPAIVTGFATPDANMHAPNERMRLEHLADAVAAARAVFTALSAAPRPPGR